MKYQSECKVRLKAVGFSFVFLFLHTLFAANPVDMDHYFRQFPYQPEALAKSSQCASHLSPYMDPTPIRDTLNDIFGKYDRKDLKSYVKSALTQINALSDLNFLSQSLEEQLKFIRDGSLLMWLYLNKEEAFPQSFSVEPLKERVAHLLNQLKTRFRVNPTPEDVAHLRDLIQIVSILESIVPSYFSSQSPPPYNIHSVELFLAANETLNQVLLPLVHNIEADLWPLWSMASLQPFFPDFQVPNPRNSFFHIPEPFKINLRRIVGGAMLFGSGKATLILAKSGDSSMTLGQFLSSSIRGYLLLDSEMQAQTKNVVVQQLLYYVYGRLRLKSKGVDKDTGRFPISSLPILEDLKRNYDLHLVSFLESFKSKLQTHGTQLEEMEQLLTACLSSSNLDQLKELKGVLIEIQKLLFEAAANGAPPSTRLH